MNTRPFLARPGSFKEAHPEIESLKVSFQQDTFGFYGRNASYIASAMKTQTYNESNIPPAVPCVNPRCQQGGINLRQFIQTMTCAEKKSDKWSTCCSGHEGSPKGRKIGNPCDNHYEIEVHITYRTPTQPNQNESKQEIE